MEDLENCFFCQKCKQHETGTFRCFQDDPPCCRSQLQLPGSDRILTSGQQEGKQKLLWEMQQAIQSGRAGLVLGAGVSAPAGMPLWTDLVSRLMGRALMDADMPLKMRDKRLLELARELYQGQISILGHVNPMESAEYIAQILYRSESHPDEENEDRANEFLRLALSRFLDGTSTELFSASGGIGTPWVLLRQALEKAREAPVAPRAVQEMLDALQARSALAASGAAPFLASEEERKWAAEQSSLWAVSRLLYQEPGIRQVMTYNYDPLVQEQLLLLFGLSPSKIITHPGMWSETAPPEGAREFHHVHGFVAGRNRERYAAGRYEQIYPAKSGPLILSEDSYYRIEREEAYNWGSSIQSYFLNRYACMFVGFSADDYNFRRILRQLGTHTRISHYLIMTIDDWLCHTYESICTARMRENRAGLSPEAHRQISEDAVKLLQRFLKSRQLYWNRYGIHPVWVTKPEIAPLLSTLI